MEKTCVTLLIAVFMICSTAICLADEEKDHVCFRALDADKDDMVTFQEFEKFYGNEKKRFIAADKDGDGKLTHDEYHDSLGHGSM